MGCPLVRAYIAPFRPQESSNGIPSSPASLHAWCSGGHGATQTAVQQARSARCYDGELSFVLLRINIAIGRAHVHAPTSFLGILLVNELRERSVSMEHMYGYWEGPF
jgi:hypothetical protein